ncbi:MAG: CHASE3 domain-containing protein [Gemmatimonadota bacterium]
MTYGSWQSSKWLRHTREVQFTGERALELALDRQAAVVAYVIGNDTTLIAPERRARLALSRDLDSLANLTRDNPSQESEVELIRIAVSAWDSSFTDPVLHARDSIDRMRIGRHAHSGMTTFAPVRARIEDFLQDEAELYAGRVLRNSAWREGEVVVLLEAIFVVVALARMRRQLTRGSGVAASSQGWERDSRRHRLARRTLRAAPCAHCSRDRCHRARGSGVGTAGEQRDPQRRGR